jgi:hypothetical protein
MVCGFLTPDKLERPAERANRCVLFFRGRPDEISKLFDEEYRGC